LNGEIFGIRISPDGKYLIYAAKRENKHALYIWDIKNKLERKLIGG